ncbi:DUF3530 family protein [methane-oxidizing endosymbiont of Gigantopelta aegis]|uniref:DUF3530 family protein n=1 Tax=methane-oxidizing endosymbiont of Gigantopelta aegis TaxID=2794938 RepID=UPI0018DC6007|nr:DUF3530 family protein [methane-oxidizing endosymbiont of Gigantopelta aegis]
MKIRWFLILCLSVLQVQASDVGREQRYAALVQQTLKTGDIVWLKHKDRKFIALYTQTEQDKNLGAAIILHDRGGYPDQFPLIHGLRIELPAHRWASLSLQLPILEEGAPMGDYQSLSVETLARIDAAVNFLRQHQAENIVLVGVGLGASDALAYAAQNNRIKALVLISTFVPADKQKQQQFITKLSALNIPVLDIYAENDWLQTRLTARKRRLAGRENADFRQLIMPDTGHAWRHTEVLLIKRVYSWLSRQFL